MKLRRPPGCGAVSHAGRLMEFDQNGFVEADDEAASALLAHGFWRVAEAEAKNEPAQYLENVVPISETPLSPGRIDRLKRNELFALLKANGVSVSLPITNESLRALAQRFADDPAVDDVMKGS